MVNICIYFHICIHTHTPANTQNIKHTHPNTRTHTYTHTCTHTHRDTHTHTHAHTHTRVCTHVHMYMQDLMLTNNTLDTAEELQQQMEVSKHVFMCILWYTHFTIHMIVGVLILGYRIQLIKTFCCRHPHRQVVQATT